MSSTMGVIELLDDEVGWEALLKHVPSRIPTDEPQRVHVIADLDTLKADLEAVFETVRL